MQPASAKANAGNDKVQGGGCFPCFSPNQKSKKKAKKGKKGTAVTEVEPAMQTAPVGTPKEVPVEGRATEEVPLGGAAGAGTIHEEPAEETPVQPTGVEPLDNVAEPHAAPHPVPVAGEPSSRLLKSACVTQMQGLIAVSHLPHCLCPLVRMSPTPYILPRYGENTMSYEHRLNLRIKPGLLHM